MSPKDLSSELVRFPALVFPAARLQRGETMNLETYRRRTPASLIAHPYPPDRCSDATWVSANDARRVHTISVSVARELVIAAFLLVIPAIVLPQSAPGGADSSQLSSGSLGPGDFIVLKIWREPDLSDTVQVDNAGLAVFPKLGPIPVTGIQPDSLERLLVRDYSQYLQNPSIVVAVMRRITIFGAVMRPGTYPVGLTMAIPDALALAGGASTDGKSDKVELRRGNKHTMIDLSGEPERVADLSLRSGDQLVVPRRSWVSRNPGVIVGSVGALSSIIYLLVR
jgi:protein involved in polysaccharide export with SLBB domain